MKPEYIYIALTAVFWGGYPLVVRATGVTGPVVALIMSVGSLAVIVIATLWQGVAVRPAGMEVLKIGIAGAMLGLGLLTFNVVANSRTIDASVSVPIIDTAMLLTTVVGAIVLFAEPLTARKLLGLGLLLAGIAVLKPE